MKSTGAAPSSTRGAGWTRLELVHRDFSDSNNPEAGSMVEKMMLATQRSWRRLQFFQNSINSAKTSAGDYKTRVSSADGSYLTSLTIGTPGVSFTAIVDTGSDLVWRQCQPCVECYNQSGTIFDPSRSSTYNKASCHDSLCQALPMDQAHCTSESTCQYSYSYGDGSSTSGDVSYDTLRLTDSSSGETHSIPHFGFGCAHDTTRTADSFSGAGGLVGLGQGPLSLTSQLSAHKLSYCLVSIADSTSQTSPMFFGDSATLTGSHIQSTPIITNPLIDTFYYLALKGISVGGNRLDIPTGAFDLQTDGTGGTIIDSGTTLTILVDAGYQPLLSAFKSAIQLPIADGSKTGLDLCYVKSGPVPSLTLHFDGADIDLPTENYFVDFNGLFCLAFASSSQIGSISIFGNIQQQNFHFLYDRSSHKLSFSPTKCDSL